MKKLSLFLLCLSIFSSVSCSSKLTYDQAISAIKSGLKLQEQETVEVLGTTIDSKSTAQVKFSFYGRTFSGKLRKYDQGWQLDEIQNDSGTWIPASTISNARDESTKIKAAIAEIKTIAITLADYITDKAVPPSSAGSYNADDPIYQALCPLYIRTLPIKDPWGNNYQVFCGKRIDGQYGLAGSATDDFLVFSMGRDGIIESWVYNPSDPTSGLYKEVDGNRDLVNFNGVFIRGTLSGLQVQ